MLRPLLCFLSLCRFFTLLLSMRMFASVLVCKCFFFQQQLSSLLRYLSVREYKITTCALLEYIYTDRRLQIDVIVANVLFIILPSYVSSCRSCCCHLFRLFIEYIREKVTKSVGARTMSLIYNFKDRFWYPNDCSLF